MSLVWNRVWLCQGKTKQIAPSHWWMKVSLCPVFSILWMLTYDLKHMTPLETTAAGIPVTGDWRDMPGFTRSCAEYICFPTYKMLLCNIAEVWITETGRRKGWKKRTSFNTNHSHSVLSCSVVWPSSHLQVHKPKYFSHKLF